MSERSLTTHESGFLAAVEAESRYSWSQKSVPREPMA